MARKARLGEDADADADAGGLLRPAFTSESSSALGKAMLPKQRRDRTYKQNTEQKEAKRRFSTIVV